MNRRLIIIVLCGLLVLTACTTQQYSGLHRNGENSGTMGMATAYAVEQPTESKSASKYVLMIEGGPVWTTSRLYYDESGNYTSGRLGKALNLSFCRLWPEGYGVGFDACLNTTSIGVKMWSHRYEYTYDIKYFGPKFVYVGAISNRWHYDFGLGVGYGVQSDESSGLGLKSSIGIEYRPKGFVALGISAFDQVIFFKQNSDNKMPDNVSSGIKQLGVALGLRFYW